ncbi:MAG: hypothetical protein FIA91_01170 [Geobacter sp.]|nr:hypothetical protein [Geobacter sp.]
MAAKPVILTIYNQNHLRRDWQFDFSGDGFIGFLQSVSEEMSRFGIAFSWRTNPDHTVEIKSYGDLLNAVRLTSPADGVSSRCVGHIIGKSQNLDLMEDLRRAINRVAFAPETIPPDDENRKVCHNCGCGC